MASRILIAHFDLDSFFVSVELINNPELKGKPVIVGGSKERGVVTSASYEARKFGVRSGMPSAQAARLCPDAIFLRGSYGEYSKYSKMVTEIIRSEVPVFEKASVDEFYIDLTGMDKYYKPFEFVLQLRQRIMNETGLPISFGLASNKMVAKIATNQAKPNGYLMIPPGSEQEFLAPLPVKAIPGVGKTAVVTLNALGIYKIGDLSNADDATLEQFLGKWGQELKRKSLGIHTGSISNFHEAKSISAETTFHENLTDHKDIEPILIGLTERVCFQLRTDERVCTNVGVKIKYTDFKVNNKQTMIAPTAADDEIIPVVRALLKKVHNNNKPLRLIGVKLSGIANNAVQASLFFDTEKKKGLYKAIDNVKNRFGKDLIKRASSS